MRFNGRNYGAKFKRDTSYLPEKSNFFQPHLKKFPLLKAPPRVMIIETISLYELKFVVIVKYVVLPGDRWQGRNGQLNVMFGR